jgi:hypothetical protein
MTGHFLRGGVVYGFDPDINSSTFGLVLHIIPKTQAGNTSQISPSSISSLLDRLCKTKSAPNCICFYPLPIQNTSHQLLQPWSPSALNFTSLFSIRHIECFRRSACNSQPLLRLGRYTPVQRFSGYIWGHKLGYCVEGLADVVVCAYV